MSMIIRHEHLFSKLENCTVIEGFLSFQLMQSVSKEQFKKLSFPLLREITDYLVVTKMFYLSTLSDMFPNLAVIRGQNLFYNYALVLYSNPHLETIGLRSLTTVLRGDVSLTKNFNLCYISSIDWSHILVTGDITGRKNKDLDECLDQCKTVNAKDVCPKRKIINSNYASEYLCWDQEHCQVGECPGNCEYCYPESNTIKDPTGNALNHTSMTLYRCCHEYCLGGCNGPTSSDCITCRGVIFKGQCQSHCPANYYEYLNRRCVTADECVAMPNYASLLSKKRYAYKATNGQCEYYCPQGYNVDEINASVCVKCPKLPCPKLCDAVAISSIEHAQLLKGCAIINGSLVIDIPGSGAIVKELEYCLSEIIIIKGILKVIRTDSLLSLGFLKNLHTIGGDNSNDVMVNDKRRRHSVVIFDNKNLEHLWDTTTHPKLKILKGSVFFHFNPRLCLSVIKEFTSWTGITYEAADISAVSNGDRMACFIQEMTIKLLTINSNSILVSWIDEHNRDKREIYNWVIYYRKTELRNLTIYMNLEVCDNEIWKTKDVDALDGYFQPAYSMVIGDLEPATTYAFFVRLMTIRSASRGARSNITYIVTSPSKPTMIEYPTITEHQHSLEVEWSPPSKPNGNILHYHVTVTRIPHDPASLLQKDFCKTGVSKERPLISHTLISTLPTTLHSTMVPPDSANTECCSCVGKKKKTSKGEVKEMRLNIDFENMMQNRIYRKNSEADSQGTEKKNIDGTIDINEYYQKYVIDNSSTKPIKYVDDQLYNTSLVRLDSNNTQEIYDEILDKHITSIEIPNLDLFNDYLVKIVVCLTLNQLCSDPSENYARTLENKNADEILSSNITHRLITDPKETKWSIAEIKWSPPSKPNGFIVAYKIVIKSAENTMRNCISASEYAALGNGYSITIKVPDNYTYQIRAMSIAQLGPWSEAKFFIVEDHSSPESRIQIIVTASVSTIFFVILIILAIVYFVLKQNGYLVKYMGTYSMNPDYGYVADEWEVPRDSIKILSVLGQGSFGAVHHGLASGLANMNKDETLRVAIKTVNDKATINDRIQFLKEASVMKAFSCVHVVKLLGVVSVGQPTLVIMELMANGDLKKFLHLHRTDQDGYDGRDAPTVNQIMHWAGEIADGMAYLSMSKFVHRDLAARNCMVSEDFVVKIGDFGMTRDIYDLDYYRKDGRGLLPVRWMSPESLRDGKFDSQSDSWSFGVVLWEMVTLGELPYQGFSNDEVLRYVVDHGVMQIPIGCPQKLADVMLRCWRFRPRQRPTFSEIIRLLEDCLSPDFKEHSYYFNSSHTSIIITHTSSDEGEEDDDGTAGGVDYAMDDHLTDIRALKPAAVEPSTTGDTGYTSSMSNGECRQAPPTDADTQPESVPLMSMDHAAPPPVYRQAIKPPPPPSINTSVCRINPTYTPITPLSPPAAGQNSH